MLRMTERINDSPRLVFIVVHYAHCLLYSAGDDDKVQFEHQHVESELLTSDAIYQLAIAPSAILMISHTSVSLPPHH